jgi:hypothetical protein
MAVNPLSKPLHTEYKPLGLEAFAQPLSDMQAKFDTTKSAIEAADFAMSRLGQDDDRSKELLKEIESKRDELAKNLMSTGNYRQAADKLVELNKVYNKDAETNAIQGNYKAYQEAVKKERERVDKGQITEADFKRWDFRARDMFKGTKYDKKEDKYNSINVSPLMENKEKEILDLSLKIAAMAPSERMETLGQLGYIDPVTQQAISTTVDSRSLPKVAGEIERFLRNSDQYKDWNQQDADLKWYYNTKNDETYQDNFVGSYLNKLEDEANYYKEILDSKDASSEDKVEAKKLHEAKTNELQNTMQDLQEADNAGMYDEYAQELFRKNNDKRFDQIGYTASDIVDFNSVTKERVFREDSEAKARRGKAQELLDTIPEMTVVTNTSESRGAAEEQTITGGATSSVDENVKVNASRETFESLKAHTIEKDQPQTFEKINTIVDPEAKELTAAAAQTALDYNTTITRRVNHINNIEATEALIKEQLAEQQKADTPAKKKEIQAKIDILNQDKEEARLAYTSESATLDNLIETELAYSGLPQETKDSYTALYNKDPEAFLRTLKKGVENLVEYNTKDQAGLNLSGNPADANNIQNATEVFTENYNNTPDHESAPEFPNRLIPIRKTSTPEEQFALDVMEKFRYNAKASFNTVGTEVVVDAGSDKLTDGKLKELTTYIMDNQRGSSDVIKLSKFNTLTGEGKVDPSGNEFNLANYQETPHFAGSDKDGNLIFRYVLKTDFDPTTGRSKGAIADAIKAEKGIGEQDPYNAKDPEIQAWLKKNPTNLYVAVSGTSHNPALHAEKNYTKIAEAATILNNPEAMVTNMNNYAPFHMLQNADRRKAYFKMTARLKDAVDNKHEATELIQAPAAWKPNDDGSYTGYQITYTVHKGEIQAKINEARLRDGKVSYTEVGSKVLNSEFNNLSNALVSMDLMYGTGREEDVVYQQQSFGNAPFVPAFINPQMYTGTFLNK